MTFVQSRRGVLAAVAACAICHAPAAAQACPEAGALTRGMTEPLATVRYLADDALGGRLAGSPGERCAADFIAARFSALGLRAAGTGGTWYQDVPLASALNPHAPGGTGRNVIALLEGVDPAVQDELIIIGAHYDHLGSGGAGSLAPGDTAIHNGADDNASGVAALLLAAGELVRGPRPARSVLFIAFTGEESGLLGSAYFTRSPTVPLGRARAMLNMDMVGRLGTGSLIVYGIDTATEWRGLLEEHGGALGVPLALRGAGTGPSDHTSFYTADIPVLHFFTNTHSDYHRPSDDWERIDAEGLARVGALVVSLTRQLATPETRLTLQRGAAGPPRVASRGSGAWLGTVPDFSPVERGVLLGGVTAGSPADQAGLKKGDVLVGLGTSAVTDLESFTAALGRHRPGDEVDVTVLRDGRELKVRAVLGRRGG